MGRAKRSATGGLIYHVLNRANARIPIFGKQKGGRYRCYCFWVEHGARPSFFGPIVSPFCLTVARHRWDSLASHSDAGPSVLPLPFISPSAPSTDRNRFSYRRVRRRPFPPAGELDRLSILIRFETNNRFGAHCQTSNPERCRRCSPKKNEATMLRHRLGSFFL